MPAALLPPPSADRYATRPMSVTDDVRAALIAAEKHYTLTELAERAKIPRPKLSLFKSGGKDLSVEGLERLAAALGHVITLKKSPKND